MDWVAGVDGCPEGWAVALRSSDGRQFRFRIIAWASELLCLPENPVVSTIDMPIGLLDQARRGGRDCDPIARRILKAPRASSVFTPPVRAALLKRTYQGANQANRASSRVGLGISRQCFGLFPKLLEIDGLMTPALQQRIKEIHPELCFTALNQGRPLAESKHTESGRKRRRDLLIGQGYEPLIGLASADASEPDDEDVLDACAACWSAERIRRGVAVRIPESPVYDSHGLSMEMWW